jgi:hypothetical protein
MSVQEQHTGPRIVAGVDGSLSSVSALRWAARQAALTGAAVDAVIAWQYPAAGYGWAAAGTADSRRRCSARSALRASRALPCRRDPRQRPCLTDNL